jgi:hypothetical protein
VGAGPGGALEGVEPPFSSEALDRLLPPLVHPGALGPAAEGDGPAGAGGGASADAGIAATASTSSPSSPNARPASRSSTAVIPRPMSSEDQARPYTPNNYSSFQQQQYQPGAVHGHISSPLNGGLSPHPRRRADSIGAVRLTGVEAEVLRSVTIESEQVLQGLAEP